MLHLKCTGKAQKAIGLCKTDLVEAQAVSAPLGNWYVHRFLMGRTRFFLFMSEANLLSFVLYHRLPLAHSCALFGKRDAHSVFSGRGHHH
ncbi:MAG TPA: hypothetical protein VFY22_01415 [Hydrogenophaga sp.]|nr:hypothetical protein [Hydrogenophaga sp.]